MKRNEDPPAPVTDDELGGDPACWAHLFDDEITPAEAMLGEASGAESGMVDLHALARTAESHGVAWAQKGEDLNVNLLVFGRDDGVASHVNNEVEVLIVAISGEGILDVDGVHRPLRAGQALVVPKGAKRGIRSASDPFAYLTCHRRRAGLWPAPLA